MNEEANLEADDVEKPEVKEQARDSLEKLDVFNSTGLDGMYPKYSGNWLR